MKTVLVLGGQGFIGRHTVRALRRTGCHVIVGTRNVRRLRSSTMTSSSRFVEVHLERLHNATAWRHLLSGIDVVINCVGILRERHAESWLAVHRDAPLSLYQACNEAKVSHLIHVSALGLHADAKSGFITSKLQGDEALRLATGQLAGAACSIVRPSLLEGADGFGSRWLRRLAKLPVLLMPTAIVGKLAVLDVDDLAEAIAILATQPASGFAIEELGGDERRTMTEHLAALRCAQGASAARILPIPLWFARAAAGFCDAVHLSPLSLGHLELMCSDNVPKGRRLAELLQREPRAIGAERASSHRPERLVVPA